MDYKNGQNLRKNNVLQIFAFAFHIVTDKVEQRLNEVGNLLTMWGTNLNEDAFCHSN